MTDDETMDDDARFDAWLSRMVPTVDAPPATPRESMWAAIESRRAAPEAAPLVLVPRRRATRWAWPAAVAAALVIGAGIDRLWIRSSASPAPSRPAPAVAAVEPAAAPASRERLYRMAAVQTLGQAEALLVAYRASGVAVRDPVAARQLAAWGRHVLTSTRLLLDSPAGDDPALRALLNDLELALVQIIQQSDAPLDPIDRELIDRSLREHDLLPRIRSTVPAGLTASGAD